MQITDVEMKEMIEAVEAKLQDAVGKYKDELTAFRDRLKELEQKSFGVPGGAPATKGAGSLAAEVKKDPAFADFMQTSAKKSFAIEVKSDLLTKNTITGDSGSPAEPNSILSPADRYNGVISSPERRLRIRDLLPVFSASSNKVEFTRESAFTNDAAPQAGEGAAKAESDVTFELAEASVITIAHFIKSSKQALNDSPYLEQFLNRRLTYGVLLKEEDQLLNGDGTSPNMSGLLDSGNFTAFNPSTGDTKIDVLRKAITALQLADFGTTGIVLNPSDWEEIELTKDNEGRYIFANAQRAAMPQLWGVPVVPTNSIAEGTFLVGDFPQAAALWDRETAVVEVGYVDDDFTRNLVTIRAEERLALTVFRPAALRSGSFM